MNKIVYVFTLLSLFVAKALAEASLRRSSDYPTSSQMMNQRSLNILPNARWKERNNGVVQVAYSIITANFTSDDIAMIENAITELSNELKVVKFVPRTNQKSFIKIEGQPQGCYSTSVGKLDQDNYQTVNLATPGCMVTGIIQHELLHALGFDHEQTRDDRDSFVLIDYGNIDEKQVHNFNKRIGGFVLGTPYDYSSVMHYGRHDFAINGDLDTITPLKAGAENLGQRIGLSIWDVMKVRLLYQCISGPRDVASYESSPCTSDCPCWEGATGCNSNDECVGGLVCSNHQCMVGQGGGSTGGGCIDEPGWQDEAGYGCDWYEANQKCVEYGDFPGSGVFGKTANQACCACGGGSLSGGLTFLEFRNGENPSDCLDLYNADTTNGNRIIQYPCNGTPAQKWFVDNNFYIRSAIDINKCIVAANGVTTAGTNLVINDCYANDPRFVFLYFTDKKFRPRIENSLCVGTSRTETFYGSPRINLAECTGSHQEWISYAIARRGLHHEEVNKQARDLQDTCSDVPNGWYDLNGNNCAWYAQGNNCVDYGSMNKNFGKTANVACCACGGGTALAGTSPAVSDGIEQDAVASDTGCYDFEGFKDSVGDGCLWYEQGDNCAYYGAQFRSAMGTANEACCKCGGGTSEPPTPSNDENMTPGCSNSPSDWRDSDGESCAFYAENEGFCEKFGDAVGYDGKTAKQACCVCGGGYLPTSNRILAENDMSAATFATPLSIGMTMACLFLGFAVPFLG